MDYATAKITTLIADTKSGWNFIAFLTALLKATATEKSIWFGQRPLSPRRQSL
ncbi:MAG: hypothetical protein IPK83_11390 [Planctomycetes bacterium]|nr:hypothetical protein [Planctomycetota bacterium]